MVSCVRGKVVVVNAATRVSKWIAGRSSNSLPSPPPHQIPRKALITCFCTGSKAPINHHFRPEAFRSENASILPKSQHRIFKVLSRHIWGTFTWTENQPQRDVVKQCISMGHSHYTEDTNTCTKQYQYDNCWISLKEKNYGLNKANFLASLRQHDGRSFLMVLPGVDNLHHVNVTMNEVHNKC